MYNEKVLFNSIIYCFIFNYWSTEVPRSGGYVIRQHIV